MSTAEIVEGEDRLIARAGDQVLFEYVFRPRLPRELAPRPYFHPVRTLAGTVLTRHQPEDHLWHLGIAYSWPVVNGLNFWGGPTFVRGKGYQHLDNHGSTRHLGWQGLDEELEWLGSSGERLALERRRLGLPAVAAGTGAWSLELATEIENSGLKPIRFGSPTTEGRPMAGYAGLAWRGVDALRAARVLFEPPPPAPAEEMGHRSRWIGIAGAGVTFAIAEHPANPGSPNRWFVRTEEYPLVTSSPVFDRYLELGPGERLLLRHRLLVADGAWSAEALGRELEPRPEPVEW
jgi:hypothetical protein